MARELNAEDREIPRRIIHIVNGFLAIVYFRKFCVICVSSIEFIYIFACTSVIVLNDLKYAIVHILYFRAL